MKKKINVVIWNENVHEREQNPVGDYIRSFYPNGIHEYLKSVLLQDDLQITAVSLDMPEQGLPDSLLEETDVLVWWGHCAHDRVADSLVDKIQERVHRGMGLICLHSAHFSKIFKRMMGSSCSLHWREVGEKERVWTVAPYHPIAQGIPESFVIPHSEMYGECFEVPEDGRIIFMSWYEGGNVFRSGLTFQRDNGKIFYFSPGHETYPIYHDENVQHIIANAIRWAAPEAIQPPRVMWMPEPPEKVYSENPLNKLDTSALHKAQ